MIILRVSWLTKLIRVSGQVPYCVINISWFEFVISRKNHRRCKKRIHPSARRVLFPSLQVKSPLDYIVFANENLMLFPCGEYFWEPVPLKDGLPSVSSIVTAPIAIALFIAQVCTVSGFDGWLRCIVQRLGMSDKWIISRSLLFSCCPTLGLLGGGQ